MSLVERSVDDQIFILLSYARARENMHIFVVLKFLSAIKNNVLIFGMYDVLFFIKTVTFYEILTQ